MAKNNAKRRFYLTDSDSTISEKEFLSSALLRSGVMRLRIKDREQTMAAPPNCTAEDFRFAISAKLELVILRDRGHTNAWRPERDRERESQRVHGNAKKA